LLENFPKDKKLVLFFSPVLSFTSTAVINLALENATYNCHEKVLEKMSGLLSSPSIFFKGELNVEEKY